MALISVIMPTYKVEEYFQQCIESVLNQTLKDIEIIPVVMVRLISAEK